MLRTSHNAGFFSCCSVKLDNIVDFFNNNRCLPFEVDSSLQYDWYKPKGTRSDITFEYFEHYNKSQPDTISWERKVDYYQNKQFENYFELDFAKINPFVRKYFSPSVQIQQIQAMIEKKYEIDYSNLCTIFYRGNDKSTEIKLTEYDTIIERARSILEKEPNLRFLIQSDETEFIERMMTEFPNSVYFKDEIRHMRKTRNTVDRVFADKNFEFSKYYLAITIIMSKSKHLICGSGNCDIWIVLYRGHMENVHQSSKNVFY